MPVLPHKLAISPPLQVTYPTRLNYCWHLTELVQIMFHNETRLAVELQFMLHRVDGLLPLFGVNTSSGLVLTLA
jgi:hypothetical protein